MIEKFLAENWLSFIVIVFPFVLAGIMIGVIADKLWVTCTTIEIRRKIKEGEREDE